jgi:hypothetical protein
MNAAYSNQRVKSDARAVHVEFDIRNDTAEPWRGADGFGVGHHLFDAESGTLIVDGARIHPARDIAPGESLHVALDFDLPPEDGHYQVRLSPMRENVCWYYDKGWDFLALDARVKAGVANFGRLRVTDREKVRRERELRAVGRAFVYPALTIWRNRSLIRVMVRRDILGRYRGSFGGSFWTIINPLLLMLTYFFVFGVVIRDPALTLGIRALLPRRNAALAAFQRGRRALARCHPGTSQFRQEAGFRGGNAPREPGGFGTGHRIIRRTPLLRFPVGHPPRHPAHHLSGCRRC